MTSFTVETNLTDLSHQNWPQIVSLLIALALCTLIGLERELRQKSAGLRTHTLVGLGAALFMLVSKYGFGDVVDGAGVVLDPSRVAAQIVSGVGFIGGGLIFVHRSTVRGITTAAVVWVSAAVGTACGAGLWLLGAAVTAAHFLVVFGYPRVLRLLTRRVPTAAQLRLTYLDGRGVLRRVLALATRQGFAVDEVHTSREPGRAEPPERAVVELSLHIRGSGDINELAMGLAEAEGVLRVHVGEDDG
ncbi:MgtC/SapB family protein [Marinitenerispora sediminis]|uniref:Magnesium transporter MgtC n=1 Tax=Marinitenerispora sediminis TaxID=1931232 RepID=A0A368SZ38_9ACTN|nr:MgtC/SapB family protein [Marinitenerispora sediminis]RCV48509.1 magnesium transporter MgtC [Marinitenerispora sediminis]RCV50372.1 magnesium transporter MgtC [Marinitenerispora sediminis]RCV57424.1 magnesium transporter MgtC [Marinitenerispora sediminis]